MVPGGNAEYFQIVDRRNRSTTRKPLDREEPPKNLFFVVESSNDCAKEPDPIRSDVGCQDIDTSSDTYLNVSVKVFTLLDLIIIKRFDLNWFEFA